MARSILTDAERVAWERFPADPDPDAIGIYFTLADGEIDTLRRLPTPGARLSTAVAVAAIRWIGFIPAELAEAPAVGVARLAGQLDGDPADLAAYAPAERTAREHRHRVAQIARFGEVDDTDLGRLEDLLVAHALEHDSPLALLRTAARELLERQLLRPGVSTLERLVASACSRRARNARAPVAAAGRCGASVAGCVVRDGHRARCRPPGSNGAGTHAKRCAVTRLAGDRRYVGGRVHARTPR